MCCHQAITRSTHNIPDGSPIGALLRHNKWATTRVAYLATTESSAHKTPPPATTHAGAAERLQEVLHRRMVFLAVALVRDVARLCPCSCRDPTSTHLPCVSSTFAHHIFCPMYILPMTGSSTSSGSCRTHSRKGLIQNSEKVRACWDVSTSNRNLLVLLAQQLAD